MPERCKLLRKENHHVHPSVHYAPNTNCHSRHLHHDFLDPTRPSHLYLIAGTTNLHLLTPPEKKYVPVRQLLQWNNNIILVNHGYYSLCSTTTNVTFVILQSHRVDRTFLQPFQEELNQVTDVLSIWALECEFFGADSAQREGLTKSFVCSVRMIT